MRELETLAGALDRYHLYPANRRALELTNNPAQQALLEQRLTWN